MLQLQNMGNVNTPDYISTLINPDTQLRNTLSTKLFTNEPGGLITFVWKPGIVQGVVTQLKEKEIPPDISSFQESVFEDFDINSKFIYKKSYKIKVKIKAISKFSPQIVID